MSPPADPLQILKDAGLFQNFPDDALRELAQHTMLMELPAGETLFEQDERSDSLYVLAEGQVHLVRRYLSGDPVVLATEAPYYVIGELSMIADHPRTAGVVAVSDCTLAALGRAPFLEVCRRHPEAAIAALQHLAGRLYRMNLLVREYALGNVPARVASLLLLMSGGGAGALPGDVRVNRVARAAGVDADVIGDLFKRWTAAGLIAYDGRRLDVLDADALSQIAG